MGREDRKNKVVDVICIDYRNYCQLSGSILQDRLMLNCFKVLDGCI